MAAQWRALRGNELPDGADIGQHYKIRTKSDRVIVRVTLVSSICASYNTIPNQNGRVTVRVTVVLKNY